MKMYSKFVLAFVVLLFTACAGTSKTGETTENKSMEAEEPNTSQAEEIQPCMLLTQDDIESVLGWNNAPEGTPEVFVVENVQTQATCTYEWDDRIIYFSVTDRYTAKAGMDMFEAGIAVLEKGVTAKKDGAEFTAKGTFERVSGVGDGAAWLEKRRYFVFVKGSRVYDFTLDLYQEEGKPSMEDAKALAQKIIAKL
ncbi:MAG: hypothetical protein AAF740_10095 [Bacteroidota bacterium]